MAAGWFSILQKVPWSDVLVNAPAVAQGARKLWGTVAGKAPEAHSPQAPATTAEAAPATAPEAVEFASRADVQALQERLARAEAGTAELQAQMRASSALIASLAEQNAQLVVRMEMLARRLAWLAIGGAVVGALAAGALAVGVLR